MVNANKDSLGVGVPMVQNPFGYISHSHFGPIIRILILHLDVIPEILYQQNYFFSLRL